MFAAGWEVIYDFYNHLVGKSGEFSGVGMHIGHFRAHVNQKIQACNPGVQGFFSARKWRVFIQSGVAARLIGSPSISREPCCSLKNIGGDGTPIGIPITNLNSVPPVWKPCCEEKESVKKWGRLDRCAIGNIDCKGDAHAKKSARSFLRDVTSCSTSMADINETREEFDDVSGSMPKELAAVLETWLAMGDADPRWDSMRKLLRACSCQDSLCGIVTIQLIPQLQNVIALALDVHKNQQPPDLPSWEKLLFEISKQGMGPEIVILLNASLWKFLDSPAANSRIFLSIVALLKYIGKRLQTTFVPVNHVVTHILTTYFPSRSGSCPENVC